MKKKIEDIINDKSFQNWMNQSDDADTKKWENWKQENQEQADLVEDAKLLIEGFSFKKNNIPKEQIDQSWAQLADKIAASEPTKTAQIVSLRRRWLSIAAALLLGVVAFFAIKNWQTATRPNLLVFETTSSSESFELPDGSTVHLNTHSKFSYAENWIEQKSRTVFLEGEAFFQVEPQTEDAIFKVQAKDLSIEVVGTAFNVNSKRAHTIVSLQEGKIKLHNEDIINQNLTAGQTAVYNEQIDNFQITENQSDYWSSWVTQKWTFGADITMREVLNRIEETYELQGVVQNEKILMMRPRGEVSIKSRAELLESLAYLLDLEFEIRGRQLIIDTK
ncbi:MAG: FecR domain-containing protein [Bacteroidota bacterium]